LRRLFRWLKDKGVTAVITAERGRDQLTRHGLEEYVSDCVILLDHQVVEQMHAAFASGEYRGALHATNEFPFHIGDQGPRVAITSLALNHKCRMSGFHRHSAARRDAERAGLLPRSSILLTGTAGTGKTSVGACFCPGRRPARERGALLLVRGIANQIIRNLRSSGCAWSLWSGAGCCGFTRRGHALRSGNAPGRDVPGNRRFSTHRRRRGPITSLLVAGPTYETKGMVTR